MDFEYNGKSTLNQNLEIVDFDNSDNIESGLGRDIVKSETTVTKPISNHFGTKFNNVITFTKALVKSDHTAFTSTEISSINTWLTSPILPKELIVTYSDETIYYNGSFTDIKYKLAGAGIVGIIFTFTNDAPYTYRKDSKVYTLPQPGNITFNCITDSTEDYCYPIVKIEQNSATSPTRVTLTNDNITNATKTFTCECNGLYPNEIDNQRKIIKKNGIVISDFTKIGWTQDSQIAWIRLVSGNNIFGVSSTSYPVKITITTKTPRKLGGLYEY